MFSRQKTGSVVCPSCGKLVGVSEPKCPYCGRVRPGMFGLTRSFRDLGLDLSFSDLILWTCGLAFLLSLIRDPSGLFAGGLFNILSPTGQSLDLFGMTGADQVFKEGRWWTLLSAGWLHAGLLHFGFNMFALRSLGPLTSELYGQGRFLIVYVLGSVAGFALSVAVGAAVQSQALGAGGCLLGIVTVVLGPGAVGGSLGASAGLMGLVGALLYYGRRGGSSALGQQAKTWIVMILIMGILMRGFVDNWAHIGGALAGYLVARIVDPLKPERTDHLIAGLVLYAGSAGAVVFSVLRGLL
ncbi:MAG: rhomboid family intramembrane serine protease [Acidobacteria bacterium]|nr:rhomboid family intramembrane serine protease [Acidobacteriota bacterium]